MPAHTPEPALRWAGWCDAVHLSALLRDAFAPGSALARVRFTIKVVATPHLVSRRRDAVVGMSPVHSRHAVILGAVDAIRWRAGRRPSPPEASRLPAVLGRSHCWRLVNLATRPRRPMAAVHLARAVLGFADRNGIVLVLDASADRRALAGYLRSGFEPEGGDRPGRYVRRPRP